MDNDRKSFWSAVIAALITLVGTVVAAVIVNWDDACKFFGSENCPRPTLVPPVICTLKLLP